VETARDHHLDRVFMLAPTSSPRRIAAVAKAASGFIYCQSRPGVTGFSQGVPGDLDSLLQRVRSESTLPLGVGFGISTPDQVRSVVTVADGAVVGTAFVRLAAEHPLDPEAAAAAVSELARRLKQATRA
ncbi:MAG: tryptophan synthase subunit alpha, partial [Chloroflexi bacterium]|nr:tryptophan synthase subunit alpha [Chloroflexota bacterium]